MILKKIFIGFFKLTGWLLISIITLLLLNALIQYLVIPVYDFKESPVFSGNFLYNPYQNIDSSAWKKACFQVHSRSWGGATDGKSSEQKIFDRYKYLGYDLVCISDYQKINPAQYPGTPEHIGNYEHGYGIKKNHQLNIGVERVCWIDFMFPQTRSNKQYILNRLSKRSPVVALSHPAWNHAYTTEDMKYLTGYQIIEVVSKYRNSSALWDAALSSGHAVFCIADDDGHDIDNPNVVGKCLTLINTGSLGKEEVVSSLLNGKTIGVEMFSIENESFEAKQQRFKVMPSLKDFKLYGDTIQLSLSDTAAEIVFIGHKGAVKHKVNSASSASYVFLEDDTYIRTEIRFRDGSLWFLNPVIRYNGRAFTESIAQMNVFATVSKNALFLLIIIACILMLKVMRKRKHKKP